MDSGPENWGVTALAKMLPRTHPTSPTMLSPDQVHVDAQRSWVALSRGSEGPAAQLQGEVIRWPPAGSSPGLDLPQRQTAALPKVTAFLGGTRSLTERHAVYKVGRVCSRALCQVGRGFGEPALQPDFISLPLPFIGTDP